MQQLRLTTVVAILAAGLTLGLSQARAASGPGSLDPTFGTGGVATLTIPNTGTAPTAAIEQSNGDIVVAGINVSESTFTSTVIIARFTSAGVLDNTFGTKGFTTTGIPNDDVSTAGIGVLPNGDFVVVGSAGPASSVGGVTYFLMAFTSKGVLDKTFGTNGIVNVSIGNGDGQLDGFLVQPNGQFVLEGFESATVIHGPTTTFVARFNSNGSFDTTFGTDGVVQVQGGLGETGPVTIALLTSGDYLIFNGSANVEFSSTGSLISPAETGPVSAFNATDQPVLFQSDGDFITAGIVAPPPASVTRFERSAAVANPPKTSPPPQPSDVFVDRFTGFGVADPTFTATTFNYVNPSTLEANESSATFLAFEPNGQIIAAGAITGTAAGSPNLIALARVDADGGLDTTFGTGGGVTTSEGVLADGILVESNSDVVLLTESTLANNAASLVLVRYLGN